MTAPRTAAPTPDLDAIEAKWAQTTPGQWFVVKQRIGRDAYIAFGEQGNPRETRDLFEHYEWETDYVAMAEAKQDVPALLAMVRASQAREAALAGLLGELLADNGGAVVTYTERSSEYYCQICHAACDDNGNDPVVEHTADCLITRARVALGKELT